MKNELKYYYNFDINNYSQKGNYYIFSLNSEIYVFTSTDRELEELSEIYEIAQVLNAKGVTCHKIILNNNNEIFTVINNKKYILMKVRNEMNDTVSLNEILKFSIVTRHNWKLPHVDRSDWLELWVNKLQNLEYQVSQFFKNEYLMVDSFSYYAGIVVNDIQLLREFDDYKTPPLSIAHKRLTYDTTLLEFYNPLNFVVDYSIRDISEYLKSKICSGTDVEYEYEFCLKLPHYSQNEKKLFFVRCLYPSYQLDDFEKYFFQNNKKYKKKLANNLMINSNYEKNIKKIYRITLDTIREIPYINWLVPG